MASRRPKKWHNGEVSWFDDLAGEGMIRGDNGNLYYVHYSTIESDKTRKTLSAKTPVQFQIHVGFNYSQVFRVRTIKREEV